MQHLTLKQAMTSYESSLEETQAQHQASLAQIMQEREAEIMQQEEQHTLKMQTVKVSGLPALSNHIVAAA